jgi:hypothetical protein
VSYPGFGKVITFFSFLPSKTVENATAESSDEISVSDEPVAFLEGAEAFVWNAINSAGLS